MGGVLTGRISFAPVGLLAFAAALTLGAVVAGGAHAAQGFQYGVAAGEVRAHSAHIWTRSNTTGPVRGQVATDRRFQNVVARAARRARGARDRTVQAVVRGLRANTVHHYRWCVGRGANRACSRGRFRTAPSPNRSRAITFAYTADTDGARLPGADEPFFGTFEVFRSMRREDNDFNVHLGDTMYSDTQCIPCVEAGDRPALSVPAKWRKYKENLEQPNLRRVRASAGFYSHWDDHEFINDFSIPELGRALYRRSVKAFRDYAPVTYTSRDGIYRSFRWGRNAELFFLDLRSFRSAKASATRHLRQPRHRPAGPRSDRTPEHARHVRGADPIARPASLGGMQVSDQQP